MVIVLTSVLNALTCVSKSENRFYLISASNKNHSIEIVICAIPMNGNWYLELSSWMLAFSVLVNTDNEKIGM